MPVRFGASHQPVEIVNSGPPFGVIEVQCQTLFDPSSAQALLVYTAVPGSSDHEKLAMLAAFAD